ncbi:hypothetical protein MAR_028986 [Mya arenaria]|uniref:Uncharacterized protein n=1 Tax=Mya arenaria TaxID=6604 RepID=A0ABY7DH45_MYAAR|nr:hypothetical protein MAR_028986 [Mya arenaria]
MECSNESKKMNSDLLIEVESKCGNFISAFQAVLRNEGKNLSNDKEVLFATSSFETVAIEKPLKSLHEIGQATNKLKKQIGDVEVDVGNTLEDCRSRIKTKENELSSKRNDIDKIKKEMYMPPDSPQTLVAVAAGGVTMTVLLANASDLEKDAQIKRDLAEQKEEARRVYQTIRDRERDCKNKEQEVRNIEHEISCLSNEQKRLTDVSNLLSNFVGCIMPLQLVFQDRWNEMENELVQQGLAVKVDESRCLSYNGVGTLEVVYGNIDSEKYINCLDSNHWPVIARNSPVGDYIIHDSVPVHTTMRTCQWKHKNSTSCMPRPSQSPAIKSIKNVLRSTKTKT